VRNLDILPSQLTAAWRRAGHGRIDAGARVDLHAWAAAALAPIAFHAALPVRLQAGTLPLSLGVHESTTPQNPQASTLMWPFRMWAAMWLLILSRLNVGFGSSGVSDSAHKAWQGVIPLASRDIAEHAAFSKLVGQVGRQAPDSRKEIGDGGQHQACIILELVEIRARELIGDSMGRS
jgi:hypothetical protein